jgi:hypothetical protein
MAQRGRIQNRLARVTADLGGRRSATQAKRVAQNGSIWRGCIATRRAAAARPCVGEPSVLSDRSASQVNLTRRRELYPLSGPAGRVGILLL